MNKIEQLWNRVELAALKMKMGVEELLLVIEGKSQTHSIMQTHEIKELNPPQPAAPTEAPAENPTVAAPSAAASTVGGTVGETENPTTSGSAAVSDAGQQVGVGSTAESTHNHGLDED